MRSDFRRLDAIGLDVVLARLADIAYPELAKELRVNTLNLRLWIVRERTRAFLEDAEPRALLDLLAQGYTVADLATEYEVSAQAIEHFLKAHTKPEERDEADDIGASSRFNEIRRDIAQAPEKFYIDRAHAKLALEKHVSGLTTRRFADDKTLRIQAAKGLAMQVSFMRTKDDEIDDDEELERLAREALRGRE
jgi:hypothetical protein